MPILKTRTLDPYTVRFMQPQEKNVLRSWRKLDKEVDEFLYCWERWRKWDSEPPIVVVQSTAPVGYHGVSFTASGYVNSVSQFVLPGHRGNGLAGAMIGYLLKQAHERGIPRLRFRTPTEGDGLKCWTGFGVKPFGEADGDYWFDLNISGICCVSDLIAKGPTLHLPPTTSKLRLNHYRRAKVRPLIPEYAKLLS